MPRVLWKLLVLGLVLGLRPGDHTYVHAQPAAAPMAEGEEAAAPAAPGAGGLEESPFLIEPKTVEEFFHAVTFSVDLGRPALARRYLDGMMALNPDDQALLALRDKHGPAIFLKLANVPELRPTSTQLLVRANEAFRRRGADPARIDSILKDLNGTAQQRDVAIVTLRSAGAVVVPRMIKVFRNPNGGIDRDTLINALVAMGEPVGPPLIGALESTDDSVRSMAAQVLGYVGERKTAAYLWYPAFGPNQPPAIQTTARTALGRLLRVPGARAATVSAAGINAELKRLALEHYRREYEWATNEAGEVEQWSWDESAGTVVMDRVTPQAASLRAGQLFARQALSLSPQNAELQSIVLGLALADQAYYAGWDQGLASGPGTAHDAALSAGAGTITRSLGLALQSSYPQAAIAALQVLGQVGTREALATSFTGRSPLIDALSFPNPRVQFAAAMAIMQLNPSAPFTGAERVVAILARALGDTGQRHCLVVHPNLQKSSNVAGLFSQMGYQPLTAPTGREAFKIAVSRPDIELILLDYNTIQWDLSQTIANLRADARTASIPIVIFGPEERRDDLALRVRRTPNSIYMVESSTADNVRLQLKPFLDARAVPEMTPEARAGQASAAAFWLAQIATSDRSRIYPLRTTENALLSAMSDPALAENVLRTLGSLGTRPAQQALLQLAVNEGAEEKLRELAAVQLAVHIQRYGLLASSTDAARIEPAWRAAQSPAVSTALAAVVGSLKPNAPLVTDRLNRIGPAAPPRPAAVPAAPTPAPDADSSMQ